MSDIRLSDVARERINLSLFPKCCHPECDEEGAHYADDLRFVPATVDTFSGTESAPAGWFCSMCVDAFELRADGPTMAEAFRDMDGNLFHNAFGVAKRGSRQTDLKRALEHYEDEHKHGEGSGWAAGNRLSVAVAEYLIGPRREPTDG